MNLPNSSDYDIDEQKPQNIDSRYFTLPELSERPFLNFVLPELFLALIWSTHESVESQFWRKIPCS